MEVVDDPVRAYPTPHRDHRRGRHLAPQAGLHRDGAPGAQGGLAGASVFRGIEGFGAASRIHTARILSLSEDLPVAVVIIDTVERIGAFLPQLDELVTGGLIILDDVQVHRYLGRRGSR